jgi:hypothetical protein
MWIIFTLSDNILPTKERIAMMASQINERHPSCKVAHEQSHIVFSDPSTNVSVVAVITWGGAWDVPGIQYPQKQTMTPPKESVPLDFAPGSKPSELINVDVDEAQRGLAAIRHTMWFTEKGLPTHARSCIRILKNYRNSTAAWQVLSPWVCPVS